MTDEEVGALELSHKLVISSKEFPGIALILTIISDFLIHVVFLD